MVSIARFLFQLGVVASAAQAQARPNSPWSAGVVLRQASGTQLGPELSRQVVNLRSFTARVDLSVLLQVKPQPASLCAGSCDLNQRNAASVGAFGLTGELGQRRGIDRSWYVLGATAITAVRWDGGTFGGTPPIVYSQGKTTLAATATIGVGREFRALESRYRVEVRVDRLHDSLDSVTGGRLAFSRVW